MEQEYNGFNIVPSGQVNLKRIKKIGKGTLPIALRGSYNSVGGAIRAIDLYIKSK